MKALFLLQAVTLILCLIFEVSKVRFKNKSKLTLLSYAVSVISGIAVSLFSATYRMLSIFVAIFTLLSLALRVFSNDKKGTLKSTMRFSSVAVLVILILEMLVFNFNSFHLWGSEYEQSSLYISQAVTSNLEQAEQGKYKSIDGASSVVVEFLDINSEIGTISFDTESTDELVEYKADFADESNASYSIRLDLVDGTIVNGIDNTRCVICNFSGKVSKIRFEFFVDAGKTLTLADEVKLNVDYKATFSFLRFIVFLLSAVFVFVFSKAVFMDKAAAEQKSNVNNVTKFLIIAIVVLMFAMTAVGTSGFKNLDFRNGNQITQELVDSFKNGQVTLMQTPSKELMALDNPYDWSARVEGSVYALWDHVLYEGEYYSYYGVGPVILLFLPFNLLTGLYFPSALATLIFSAVGIAFLILTFKKLFMRYFSDMPMWMYITSLVMLCASCGIWYCLIPSNFYEIAQTSGFCFVTLGAYFLVSANLFSKGSIRPYMLALGTLFLSIAVTCRPTTAIWCVVALLFICVGVRKIYQSRKCGTPTVSYVKYLLCAMLPFVVIGGLQMIYNYVRFDSFTDFGIQYSLTINDFTKAQYHTQFAAIGFYNYLFAPPSFSADFPYIFTNITDLSVNGYYFTATHNGCGLFFRALPMFFLLLAPKAYKLIDKSNRRWVMALFLAVAVVAPCIVIFSIWESGYGVRYMVDFAWQMLTCALFVMYVLYRNTHSIETKRIYKNAMLFMMILSVMVNFALTYSYIYPVNAPYSATTMFEAVSRAFAIFNT